MNKFISFKNLPEINVLEIRAKIKSEIKIINSLGGLKKLKKHFLIGINIIKKEYKGELHLIPFNLRSEAQFIHPLYGKYINNKGLLIEIHTKRKETFNGYISDVFDAFIKGGINQIIQFRGLVDFQSFPEVTKIRKPKIISIFNDKERFLLPLFPEVYSQTDKPNEMCKIKVSKKFNSKFGFINIKFDNIKVSNGPMPGYFKNIGNLYPNDLILSKLKEYAYIQPIWDKFILFHKIKTRQNFNKLSWIEYKTRIPAVFYNFVNGPWRTLLIRHGYDPRLSSNKKDSCFWQMIEFHVNQYQAKELKIKTKIDKTLGHNRGRISQNKLIINQKDPIFPLSMCHFLIPPKKLHFIYQLCFINHKNIQNILLDAKKNISKTKADQINGWFNVRDLYKIRYEMKCIVQYWIKKTKKEGFQWIKILDKILMELQSKRNN